MFNGKKALFLNLGWEQLPYVERLRELGARIVAVHHVPLPTLPAGIDELLVCDYFDIERITDFARHHAVDAVLTDQCDYALYASAVVASRLGLPGPSLRSAMRTTNKWLQRRALVGSSVLQPAFQLCEGPGDVIAFAEVHAYPVIVKPVDARGSFGVTRIDQRDQIESAYFHALANSPARAVIAETFIQGTQLTVDGFCIDGQPRSLAVASKGMLDDKTQVAVDIHYPAKIAPPLRAKAKAVNELVARTLGLDFGGLHGEYMLTADGELYLIEIANRGGGCHTASHIMSAISGFNLIDNLIYAAFALAPPPAPVATHDAVLLKFYRFSAQGIVTRVDGLSQALTAPGVLAGRLNLQPGDTIHPVSNDANRHGFFIVGGQEDNLYSHYQEALNCLQVTTAQEVKTG